MRNESRRVWSLQVEEGGTVQEVLRRQAGFTKKENQPCKISYLTESGKNGHPVQSDGKNATAR